MCSLLLSRRARVDAKPELEIVADDVKCAHGASVGQLDRDAVFYLRSRGVGEAKARQMLIHAFVADVLEQLKPVSLREYLQHRIGRPMMTAGEDA